MLRRPALTWFGIARHAHSGKPILNLLGNKVEFLGQSSLRNHEHRCAVPSWIAALQLQLYLIKNGRLDDWFVVVLNVVLRKLTLVDFRLPRQNRPCKFFCSKVSSLYFSFERMLLTVPALWPGVRSPSEVSCCAMP